MEAEQLPTRQEIIELHSIWLTHGPLCGRRAVLRGYDFSGVNLSGVNLSMADLSGAILSCSDLRGADLSMAALSETYLSGADLSGANLNCAHLHDANLVRADLTNVTFKGTVFNCVDLEGAVGLAIMEDAPQRLQAVAAHVLSNPDSLDMSDWHTRCGTAHCIAGWAIHQAGSLGRQLELETSSSVAGLILLGLEAAQHFHDTNDEALSWLKSVAAGGSFAPSELD